VVNNSKWKEEEITMPYDSKMPSKKATKKKVEPKKPKMMKKKKKPMKK